MWAVAAGHAALTAKESTDAKQEASLWVSCLKECAVGMPQAWSPTLATINSSCHKFGRSSSSSSLKLGELRVPAAAGSVPAGQGFGAVGSSHLRCDQPWGYRNACRTCSSVPGTQPTHQHACSCFDVCVCVYTIFEDTHTHTPTHTIFTAKRLRRGPQSPGS